MLSIGGGAVNMALIWLIAMVVFLIVEGIVPGLVSIWFAIGALAALLAAALHAPVWLQLVWFLLVSVAALALTRPLAKKYVNARTQPTNADRILGKDCIVREAIDNLQGTGAVAADGKVWTARMEKDDETAAVGEVVVARRIEGVKLVVGKK
ncbi:MAG: NfeD family protein [Eubacteriales bacterium]|nr:NfeD family protein [Eubacteriales bacterium]